MTLAETIFWVAFGLIGYTYVGYPGLVWTLGHVWPRPVRRAPATPTITVLIGARNEAACIGDRIENCLALTYPADRLNIIVVSDGSTDSTVAIIEEYASRYPGRVALRHLPERQGKPTALNVGAAHASGEILLLTDARQRFDPDVALSLVQNFADPEVGAVSGELVLE